MESGITENYSYEWSTSNNKHQPSSNEGDQEKLVYKVKFGYVMVRGSRNVVCYNVLFWITHCSSLFYFS